MSAEEAGASGVGEGRGDPQKWLTSLLTSGGKWGRCSSSCLLSVQRFGLCFWLPVLKTLEQEAAFQLGDLALAVSEFGWGPLLLEYRM